MSRHGTGNTKEKKKKAQSPIQKNEHKIEKLKFIVVWMQLNSREQKLRGVGGGGRRQLDGMLFI
jgi:hypothetical protein